MGWSKFKNIDYSKYRSMFVDREEIINLFKEEYLELKNNPEYFKVIGIYGIGGIGKSYLIEKLLEIPKNDEFDSKIITINMDIMHSADIFDNLVKVRKQIETGCLYFDYSLILLWDIYKIEKLDEDFMRKIKGNFLDILNMVDSGLSAIYPSIGFENILSLYRNNILPKLQHHLMQPTIFEEIDARFQKSPQHLYEFMPYLLGLDLANLTRRHRLIAFFDSYERYLIDHDDWLKELIGSIEHGLFLVASREKLEWSDNGEKLYLYKLQELPITQAELVLKASILPTHYGLIDTIIKKTQCVPIFIELAISIYKKISMDNPEDISSEFWMIEERSDFIKRFLHHLPENDQEIVMVLSVIRIFNTDIFEWVVRDLSLNCTVLKYHDICNLCLINMLKEDDQFIKLHDVFTANALKFISTPKKQRILQSYISYIGQRGLAILSQKQLTILFRNLLTLSENIALNILDIEYLCDIFFALYENNCLPELHEWVMNTSSTSLSAFRDFVEIIYIEKIDAKKSYELSLKFKESFQLGKHRKSFDLIQNYAQAISGNYENFSNITEKMYNDLKSSDIMCWYYGKTKIYYADHLMLRGKFIQALNIFEEYARELEAFPRKTGDYFEAKKQSAHCRRFNMLLDEATAIYQRLAVDFNNSKGLLIYVLTNLCETNCYFYPDIVFNIAPEAIKLSEYLNRPKEKAKIYYSLAIAYLHNRNYSLAKQYIEKSITINEAAHYPSGVLFALMAEAFWEYSQKGHLSILIQNRINTMLKQCLVYQYFKLPLYIMETNYTAINRVKQEYQWVDFSYTLKQYKNFLSAISAPLNN